jgi:hypothetical protein
MKSFNILFILLISSMLSAQQKDTNSSGGFISIGFGGESSQGFFDKASVFTWSLSYSMFKNDNVYTLEYLGGAFMNTSNEKFDQLAGKYSKRIGGRFVKYYISSGLSISSVNYEDSNEDNHNKQILGIPLEIGITIIPIRIMAINFNISHTIRHRSPGIIMMTNISIGALR